MMTTTLCRRVFVCLGLVAWSLLGAPADDAREILGPDGLRGGLIVHVGCGDGSLTALLRGDGNAVVQGLDRDAAAVGKARGLIRSRDLYGPVSAEVWTEPFLPYADNLVNLLVVEKPALVSEAERLRVLAPGGTVCVRQGTEWARTTKPAPAGVDEWTHYLHDASGNPVAHDSVVAPPRNLQWSAPPMHTRAHEYTPGIWALVSTGGRVFFVQDKAAMRTTACCSGSGR
jgi:SAM-dependent methyltransferase